MVLKRSKLNIVYCYAREDQVLRDELEKHIAAFRRLHLIDTWFDGRILPGAEWEREIEEKLAHADIILLLVSHHFIHSDYIWNVEVPKSLERHKLGKARVIPIILSPIAGWERTEIAKLQALPKDGKPITSWSDRDLAFANIVQELSRVIENYANSFPDQNIEVIPKQQANTPRRRLVGRSNIRQNIRATPKLGQSEHRKESPIRASTYRRASTHRVSPTRSPEDEIDPDLGYEEGGSYNFLMPSVEIDPDLGYEEESKHKIGRSSLRSYRRNQDVVPQREMRQSEIVADGGGTDPGIFQSRLARALPPPDRVVGKFAPHPLMRHRYWLNPIFICMIVGSALMAALLAVGLTQRVGDPKSAPSNGKVGVYVNTVVSIPAYTVVGSFSLSPDFIDKVLDSYGSPAVGKGGALYTFGVEYNIDPIFALAFFMYNGSLGRKDESRTHLSLGHLPCNSEYICQDGSALFTTWEKGFAAWYKLIQSDYVIKLNLTTVDQIISKYLSYEDEGTITRAIAAMKHYIQVWDAGNTQV